MVASWTGAEIELIAGLAYELHLNGKDSEAFTIFEGLVAVDPGNLYCLEALAALSLALGLPEKAVEYSDRALALSPLRVAALASRCEANLLLDRFAPARQDLESLKQLPAAARVTRLSMRLATAQEMSDNLLLEATSREPHR